MHLSEPLDPLLGNELRPQVRLQTLDPAFSAVSGLVDASKRRLRFVDRSVIYADDASLEFLAHDGRGGSILGEDICR